MTTLTNVVSKKPVRAARTTGGFIRLAADIASFYGFRPLREMDGGGAARAAARTHSFGVCTSICAARVAQSGVEQLAFYASMSPAHLPAGLHARDTAEFGLQIAGTADPLSEVVLIKTLWAILTEWGASPTRVRVNAFGDRDSKQRFLRELGGFVRRHAARFDEPCRRELSDNPQAPYACQSEVCRGVMAEGPRAMNFLSEKSRLHFRALLEQMEQTALPYELDDLLHGDEREPQVLFELDFADDNSAVRASTGGRFDDHVRRISGYKESTAVHASIFLHKRGTPREKWYSGGVAPRAYFIQLGPAAKLHGLSVVELLRRSRIPVLQSFNYSRLAPQLEAARAAHVPSLIIMGAREVLDNAVLLRRIDDNAQTTLPLSTLPKFLHTLR